MALAQQQPLTLDEFLQLPEEKPALEFEDGRVSQKVSPKGRHSTLQGEIYDRVNAFARPRKLARAYRHFCGPTRCDTSWRGVPRFT